ncbi:MAG: hypothetical protein JOZ02_08925 [Acidobacteria bacterium]|nr:hypothetical protein [Acidobacteriota bacterium]
MLESFFNWRRALPAAGFALAAALAPAPLFAIQQAGAGPKPADAAQSTAKPAAKSWSVRMSKAAPYTFTVKAKESPLPEIVQELSKLVKVPVTLSPLMAKQKVTLDFAGLNLEATLRMLAPQGYIDYVAGGEGGDEPKPLALYLQGANEKAPPTTAAVHGNSEAILIEGDTEEGTDSEAQRKREQEDPLRVTWANNQLSVRARKQPLTVVLFKIASEVGVPFEMRYETPELVDVDFQNYPLDQAFRSLSPGVRFYYRVDLQTFQVLPLRLALLPPAAPRT